VTGALVAKKKSFITLSIGEDVYCFFAGEPRVNENTALASIHTLMVRTHYTFAHELAAINPHWSDETIFQVSVS
jgi:hypothetical protein